MASKNKMKKNTNIIISFIYARKMMLWKKKSYIQGFEGSNPYNSLLCDEYQNFGEILLIIKWLGSTKWK